MLTNIYQALVRQAEERGGEPALIDGRGRTGHRNWSFAEIHEESRTLAAGLSSLGVRKGDRVMLMVPPSSSFITLTFALFSLGAVVILIDPGMGLRNMRRSISRVNPRVFIGSARAQIFRIISRRAFRETALILGVDPLSRLLTGMQKRLEPGKSDKKKPGCETKKDDLAAVIFTTGSTGPPKGVQYTHRIFAAQLSLIKNYYDIGAGDRDQPAFPLFALFSIGLGATVVLPEMDPSRPARVDPARFVRTILEHEVTYSFGSPAIWKVVSRYCLAEKISLPPLKKVLMAGAPVPGELVRDVLRILPDGADVHTPYGATEALPVASISGGEIVNETWEKSRKGQGICVGRALPGNEIAIIRPVSHPLAAWSEAVLCKTGEIGEVVVKGEVVTGAYDGMEEATIKAKIPDGDSFRHRMGDMGYLDDRERLWFCGRKDHRVLMRDRVLYPIPCEALFNEHPQVSRSALVGIGTVGRQKPVLIVEPVPGRIDRVRLLTELQEIGSSNQLTSDIDTFLIHPEFPVDIRHNAKIFREKLAAWASDQLRSRKTGSAGGN